MADSGGGQLHADSSQMQLAVTHMDNNLGADSYLDENHQRPRHRGQWGGLGRRRQPRVPKMRWPNGTMPG